MFVVVVVDDHGIHGEMRNDALNVAAVALDTNPEEKDISKHIKVSSFFRLFFQSFLLLFGLFFRLFLIKSMVLLGIVLLEVILEHLLLMNQSILFSFILEKLQFVCIKLVK